MTGAGRRACVLTAALAVAVTMSVSPAAGAERPKALDTAVTDGPVESLARIGSRIFLRGEFTRIGPHTGFGASLDPATGRPDLSLPRVDGPVHAVASDGAGGFFVGGDFTHVGDAARRSLGHILPGGTVDPSFAPNPNGAVLALALAGGRLFVGGTFEGIGGRSRGRLAALDPATGAIDPEFDPNIESEGVFVPSVPAPPLPPQPLVVGQPPDGFVPDSCRFDEGEEFDELEETREAIVLALVVGDGRLYVGGRFKGVGGIERHNLAALDPATGGLADGFDPDANNPGFSPTAGGRRPDVNGPVSALAVSGDRLYVGGDFTSVAGRSRVRLAALDAATGSIARGFDPAPDAEVSALVASGGRLYVGGQFTRIANRDRPHLVALDAATGEPASGFSASADRAVRALALAGGRLYLGGDFGAVSGTASSRLAAVDATTGRLERGFGAGADGTVEAIAAGDARIYTGGEFESTGGVARAGLAAIRTRTGALDGGFDPKLGERVLAIAASRSRLYVSARVKGALGRPRERLVALDPATGAVDRRFRATAGGDATLLAIAGRRLYAVTAERILSLDARTGAAHPRFRARIDGVVLALAATARRLYVGGIVRSRRRRPAGTPTAPRRKRPRTNVGLRALARTTGARDPRFRPRVRMRGPGLPVRALALSHGRLYASGDFAGRGSRSARRLVALDARTGALERDFRAPPLGPSVLVASDRRIYLNAGPASSPGLSALSARTGRLDARFRPGVGSRVCGLAATRSRVFAGGSFRQVAGRRQRRLAGFAIG